jgi:hypothetical protein
MSSIIPAYLLLVHPVEIPESSNPMVGAPEKSLECEHPSVSQRHVMRNFLTCLFLRKGKGKSKGKFHSVTGHEGPWWE